MCYYQTTKVRKEEDGGFNKNIILGCLSVRCLRKGNRKREGVSEWILKKLRGSRRAITLPVKLKDD